MGQKRVKTFLPLFFVLNIIKYYSVLLLVCIIFFIFAAKFRIYANRKG